MSKVRKGIDLGHEVESSLSAIHARSAGNRPKGRSYLIVCEGTKTEPQYFESLRKKLTGGEGDKIVIVGAQTNTLGIVERAKEEIALRDKSDNPPYYHIWLVFDRDSFPSDDFDNAIRIAQAEDAKFGSDEKIFHPHWHAAWSNEAFELWYLFHFQENSGGAISRDRYKEMLSNHLTFKYKKNNPEMFEILLPQLQLAIERSARALARWSDGTPFHNRNPATTVHELVGELIRYI